MATRSITIAKTTFITRLLTAIVGLAIVPLTTAFIALCIALAVVVMIVAILWWVITGEWIIADSSEVADDN